MEEMAAGKAVAMVAAATEVEARVVVMEGAEMGGVERVEVLVAATVVARVAVGTVAVEKAEETAEEMVVDVEVATGVEARAGAVRAVEVTVVAATEVEMVAVVTAEEVMARMQESKRGSLQG